MAQVFVSIGSNIDPQTNITEAFRRLLALGGVVGVSKFYLTEPYLAQGPSFYNGVVQLSVDLKPLQLKNQVLRTIETDLGRVRTEDKYAPRQIDLDIIIYDDLVIDDPDLTIPDPEIAIRPFLAVPLCDLAPDIILPGTGIRLADIVSKMRTDTMAELTDFTEKIKQEFTGWIKRESRS
ncbi:MAG: 2-amino-4-hydroxy-6-hydroxymethyldihydropteridine diphosphokinase [Armatimonadetes bacterium]|jgi:dihydroneopterin aldolase/2-amino-4-hydroxy-6-hydroxymethyldihydropteridine diphosphokinase|nr:2-amino-4-hydroxy-6-hydroxymethyldihydropteridine diphosphokinase [Armatimonadota bacterium]